MGKKIIILFIGIIVAVPAFCQLDSLIGANKGKLVWIPPGLRVVNEPPYSLLRLREGKLLDIRVAGGMGVVYVPETNVDSLNKIGKQIRFFAHQIPNNATFTAEQRQQIEGLINSFITPTEPVPDPVTVVTNIDNAPPSGANKYEGTWAHTTIVGHHNNTISWSCTPGATLTTTFTGQEITWITELKSTHGLIGVSIDGGEEEIVDQYNVDFLKQQPLLNIKGLSKGPHTVRLRVTGNKHDKASNVCLVHDYFEVKLTE